MSRKSRERRKQQRQEFNCDWQVFKVQRPLGGEMSFMLVYNEDRSRTAQVPMTKEMEPVFHGLPKVYVMGRFVDGVFEIGDEVAAPEW